METREEVRSIDNAKEASIDLVALNNTVRIGFTLHAEVIFTTRNQADDLKILEYELLSMTMTEFSVYLHLAEAHMATRLLLFFFRAADFNKLKILLHLVHENSWMGLARALYALSFSVLSLICIPSQEAKGPVHLVCDVTCY